MTKATHGPQRPDPTTVISPEWAKAEGQEQQRLAFRLAATFLAGLALASVLAGLFGIRGIKRVFFIPGVALGVTAVVFGLTHWFPDAMARGFISFLHPNRGTAPAEDGYSHIQAMAVRGETARALDEYEAVIAADPGAAEARLQAAELYAGAGGNPARAAALYVELRRIPGLSAARALYASQRLIDLYDGPLDQPSRSLSELRRIIELHPASRDAGFARVALAKRRREASPDG